MGFLDSIFAAPGSSAAWSANELNNKMRQQYGDLFKSYAPIAQKQVDFPKGLEPQREFAIQQGISDLGQSGVNANINRFGNQAQERAQRGAQDQSALLRSQGYGSGVTAGLAQNAANNAQMATNQYAQDMNSPDAVAKRRAMLVSMLDQGMDPAAISTMLRLTSGISGTPMPTVGKGFGDFLGSALGGWASTGFKTGK